MKTFYQVLANTLIASVTNFTVWFAITFFVYLQTRSVFATAIISGIYLVATAVSGFWLGSLVDRFKKKKVMLVSSTVSLVVYIVSFLIYVTAAPDAFKSVTSLTLWTFVPFLMIGVLAGNLRNIALPTIVTMLIPEDRRDKANGLVGTTSGISFLVTSVLSGFLVGHSGMLLVLILAIFVSLAALIHLWFVTIPEKEIVHIEGQTGKVDIKGTLKIVSKVPGLFPLLFFTTFNNFLGGVFMALMDAYGLSLISVQMWGVLWGVLSTGFIIGGLIIAKKGLGKNPLRALFLANMVIWTISIFFTIQPWI